MVVYTFSYETGAYTGELELGAADLDPRSPDTWMIPGNATTEPPPRCDSHCTPVWKDGRWVVYECVADIADDLMAGWRKRVGEILESKEVTP